MRIIGLVITEAGTARLFKRVGKGTYPRNGVTLFPQFGISLIILHILIYMFFAGILITGEIGLSGMKERVTTICAILGSIMTQSQLFLGIINNSVYFFLILKLTTPIVNARVP
jgi:hypothetical protein